MNRQTQMLIFNLVFAQAESQKSGEEGITSPTPSDTSTPSPESTPPAESQLPSSGAPGQVIPAPDEPKTNAQESTPNTSQNPRASKQKPLAMKAKTAPIETER